MTRLVTVPAPVKAIHPLTRKPIPQVEFNQDGTVKSESPDDPWTEFRFLVICVVNRPEWLKPLSRQREANRILDKFDGAGGGTVVELSDEQWRHLRDTLEHEDFELPKHFGYQLVVFADAIIDAPVKDEVKDVPALPAPAEA